MNGIENFVIEAEISKQSGSAVRIEARPGCPVPRTFEVLGVGQDMPDDQLKTGQASFFAVRIAPKIHHTLGGVGSHADAQAQ